MSMAAVLAGIAAVVIVLVIITLIMNVDPSYRREEARLAQARRHAAPTEPLTIVQARRVMREHRACATEYCPLKHAAHRTLTRRTDRR